MTSGRREAYQHIHGVKRIGQFDSSAACAAAANAACLAAIRPPEEGYISTEGACGEQIGSRHTNMKALRFEHADGEWCATFGFDPEQKPVLFMKGSALELTRHRWGTSLRAVRSFLSPDRFHLRASGETDIDHDLLQVADGMCLSLLHTTRDK